MTTTTDTPTETTPWFMAGTEGTGQYAVLAQSSFGTIGVRPLGGGVRIRIEPSDPAHAERLAEHLTRQAGWKQPGDDRQNRFSIVAQENSDQAREALQLAYGLVKRGRPLTYNPADMPEFVTALLA